MNARPCIINIEASGFRPFSYPIAVDVVLEPGPSPSTAA